MILTFEGLHDDIYNFVDIRCIRQKLFKESEGSDKCEQTVARWSVVVVMVHKQFGIPSWVYDYDCKSGLRQRSLYTRSVSLIQKQN